MNAESSHVVCRSPEKLRAVCQWALSCGNDPFALGVLAALGYAFCKNDKTPAELMENAEEIKKSASLVGWATSWEECFCDDILATCVHGVGENLFHRK